MPKSRPPEWTVVCAANQGAEKRPGRSIDKGKSIFLCRCGASKNKPYCDGTHSATGFSDKRRRAKDSSVPNLPAKRSPWSMTSTFVRTRVNVWMARPKRSSPRRPGGGVASGCFARRASHRDDPALSSGALLYKLHGKLTHDYFTDTEVRVEKTARCTCTGQAQRRGPAGDRRSLHALPLRRVANKPFCDGRHTEIKFRDGSGA